MRDQCLAIGADALAQLRERRRVGGTGRVVAAAGAACCPAAVRGMEQATAQAMVSSDFFMVLSVPSTDGSRSRNRRAGSRGRSG